MIIIIVENRSLHVKIPDYAPASVHVSDMMTKTKAERARVLGIKKT